MPRLVFKSIKVVSAALTMVFLLLFAKTASASTIEVTIVPQISRVVDEGNNPLQLDRILVGQLVIIELTASVVPTLGDEIMAAAQWTWSTVNKKFQSSGGGGWTTEPPSMLPSHYYALINGSPPVASVAFQGTVGNWEINLHLAFWTYLGSTEWVGEEDLSIDITVRGFYVTIGDVVRGTALPFSVPPTKTKAVPVTIYGTVPSGHSVSFDIIGGGTDRGTASIDGTSSLTSSGNMTVLGGTQTEPGNAGELQIAAYYDGTGDPIALSSGFTVCAHPKEIGNNYNSIVSPWIFGGNKYWGACYTTTFVSDSDTGSDCDQTRVSEVIVPVTATGPFTGATMYTSGYITTTETTTDYHTYGGTTTAAGTKTNIENAGNTGTEIVVQYFRFCCDRCEIPESVDAPKVPTGGFKVTKTVSKDGAGKHWVHVKKEGFANNGVAAGAVNDTNVKDAEVKD